MYDGVECLVITKYANLQRGHARDETESRPLESK